MERRKCLTGRVTCFLIERGSELHGAVFLMREGRAIWIKSLYLQPNSSGRGIRSETLDEIFELRLRCGTSAVVASGVKGDRGECLSTNLKI